MPSVRLPWPGPRHHRSPDPLSTVPGRVALEALLANHLSMSRIATTLGIDWNTANTTALAEGQQLLIDQPGRIELEAYVDQLRAFVAKMDENKERADSKAQHTEPR